MRLMLVLLLQVIAAGAEAGAWPRGEGRVFLDLSVDRGRTKLYTEYGFRGDWTLGTEVTMPHGRRLPDVTAFVHHPVLRFSSGAILSAGLAVEQRETVAAAAFPQLRGEQEIAVRGGLFWGRGFETGWGDAWSTVEAQAERIVTEDWLHAATSFKLDATVGLRPNDRLTFYVQAQGYRRVRDDMMLRLEPGAAWRIGRAHLLLAPSIGIRGPRDPRVKLGVWLEF